MKNPIVPPIALILCLVAGPSFAQNNAEGMRFLAVSALMDYGQKLYDRGDYLEASAVFNRVLEYDHNQLKAMEYLKNIHPARVNVADTRSLERAVKLQQQIVEKLQSQIKRMRVRASSQGQAHD